jgi:HEAT repeat protein
MMYAFQESRGRGLVVLLVCSTSCAALMPAKLNQCQSLIQSGLQDKNPDIRKHAVEALSLTIPREPFGSLLAAKLQDADLEVRLATITSLMDLRPRNLVPTLKEALDDPTPEVNFAAAKALWGLSVPAGKQVLLSVLGGEIKTTSGFFTKQKRDALRMINTPRTMFLFALKQGAGFAPVPGLGTGISSMQGLLSDSGVSGRTSAALLLGRDAGSDTLDALEQALLDKDWRVRAAAVHSLALRNDRSVEERLIPLLEDDKEGVRLRAAAAIIRLESLKVPHAATKH